MARVRIGLLGLGTVGAAVAERLVDDAALLRERCGTEVELARVLVRDGDRARAFTPPAKVLTTDPDAVLDDPTIALVVELIGGLEPARRHIEAAIRARKAVVTANKKVMARHGPELLDQARERGVELRYEAAVGGCIPVIGTLGDALVANRVTSIEAVINGTSNVLIDSMAAGAGFDEAVARAQHLGFAEADPGEDVDGHDATDKLCVMASLAFHTRVQPDEVQREGLRELDPVDVVYAARLDHDVRLVAVARDTEGALDLRVHPACVPRDHLLAGLRDAENAVIIEGDLAGRMLLQGAGAGARATASAVLGDVIAAVRSLHTPRGAGPMRTPRRQARVHTRSDGAAPAYLRVRGSGPGLAADVRRCLEASGIAVAALVEGGLDGAGGGAEVALITAPVRDAEVRAALERIEAGPPPRLVAASLRVLPSGRTAR